jgi:hypothetical protein
LFGSWIDSSPSSNSNLNSETNIIINNDNLSLSAIGCEINGKFNAINTFIDKTLVRSAYEWNEKELIINN